MGAVSFTGFEYVSDEEFFMGGTRAVPTQPPRRYPALPLRYRFAAFVPGNACEFMADAPMIQGPRRCAVTLRVGIFPRRERQLMTFALPQQRVELRLTRAGTIRVYDRRGRFRCGVPIAAHTWYRVTVRLGRPWAVTAVEEGTPLEDRPADRDLLEPEKP